MAWRASAVGSRIVAVGVWAPVGLFAGLAWNRRWMSDDGFINLRVVWNLLHGHGPVFNAGERVEASTSPLWVGLLAVVRALLWFTDTAWIAVIAGIALSTLAIGLAIAGARAWWGSLDRTAVLPVGAGILVALPPMWDFASSGLETGLSFAWLGACWWITARRLVPEERLPLDRPRWAPLVIGLGPLVRPDLGLLSLTFGAAYVAASTRTRGAAVRAVALALTLPVGYQVFRMGYYGLLFPNTALAKESTRSLWNRGWYYLEAYIGPTWLVVALGLAAVLFALEALFSPLTRAHLVVAAAPVVGGLLHALYVVRVGGDFMYARLLLPATFAVVCPLGALPVPQRRLLWAPVAGVGAWLVANGVFLRWEPETNAWAPRYGIVDERAGYVRVAGHRHPVTLGDYEALPVNLALDLRGVPRGGEVVDVSSGESAPAAETTVAIGTIGVAGFRLLDTHVVDTLSLADPIGSHLVVGPLGKPGHEKVVPWEWVVGRFGAPPLEDYEARAARAALRCGDLAELMDAVEDPLTPGRFLDNLTGAFRRNRLRIDADPSEARAAFCND